MKRLKTLFRDNSFALVVIIIMNLIVLYNSFFHNPLTGYDAGSHIKNIQIYPFRLPSPEESSEYFSAPLPYILPSIFNLVCQAFGWPNCTVWAGKIAQFIKFIL